MHEIYEPSCIGPHNGTLRSEVRMSDLKAEWQEKATTITTTVAGFDFFLYYCELKFHHGASLFRVDTKILTT